MSKRISVLRQEIGEDAEVSMVMKRDMLKNLDGLKEGQLKAGKEDLKKLLDDAKQLAEKHAAKPEKVMVSPLPELQADPKAVNGYVDTLTKKCPDMVLCVVSAGPDKIMVQTAAPKGSKISAKAFCQAVLDACGGKGGGSDMKAQGQSTQKEKADDAIKAAKDFAAKNK